MSVTDLRPHYSASREAGDLVYLSGVVAFDENLKVAGTTIEAQTRQCLTNMAQVLKTHDLGLEHVVKTTVWLSRAEDFAAFNTTYAEVLGDSRPARSTVVSRLVAEGLLVEIEAIAARPR